MAAMSRGWRIVLVCLALGGGAVLAPWLLTPTHAVQAALPDRRSIEHHFEVTCAIEYAEQVTVRPEVAGRVSKVFVRDGETVKRGALLVALDDATLRSQFDQASAAIDVSIREISVADLQAKQAALHQGRSERLRHAGFASIASADDNSIALQVARQNAALARARLNQNEAGRRLIANELEKYTIRAPIDGIVMAVGVREGETALPSAAAIPGSELMTIANPGQPKAELLVPESFYGSMREGQPVRVDVTAVGGTYASRVAKIGQSISIGTAGKPSRYVTAEAQLADPDHLLRPNMACRADIVDAAASSVLTIPWDAVQSTRRGGREQPFVWVVRGDRAARLPVVLGVHNDDVVEVRSALPVDQKVIVGPSTAVARLTEGDRVRQALR